MNVLLIILCLLNTNITVKTSVYHPVPSQCWGKGLLTRSGSTINLKHLKAGKLRWVSLSRDLLKIHGGKYRFNDTIYVQGTSSYSGYWIVKDSMGKKQRNKIDFLQDAGDKRKPPLKVIIK